MATWKSRRKQKHEAKQKALLEKASSEAPAPRLRLGEIGTTGLAAIQDYIELIMPYELADFERRMRTFDKMALNSAVSTALDFNYILVEKAFSNFKVLPKNALDKQSIEAAKFVEYNLRNMKGQTLRQSVRNIISFKKYGFSLIEKTFENIQYGEYSGKYPYKIKKLAFRPQQSLDRSIPFKFSEDGRDLVHARQNTAFFRENDGFTPMPQQGYYKEIPRNKFMLFGYNSTDSNPFGESPLIGCFRDVKEMDIINEYQTVGVTRDMGGMLVFGIPSEILNKAAADPTGQEAMSIQRLEEQGALCHAGEQTSMILPREVLEGTNNMDAYTMKLQGVDGGGKMYSTSDILKDKQKAIFDRFGAGAMILGEGGGSYALIEGKNTIHSHYIERDINIILEVFNNDLIPQLLALNGIHLPDELMPELVAGEIEPVSLDEMSKAAQRLGSVGLLPVSAPTFLNELYEKHGFKYRLDEELSPEELSNMMSDYTSRSGEGKGTSGTGDTQAAQGGNLNMENKSFTDIRVDAKGIYSMSKDGKRTYINLDDLPEELREGFNIKG
ncbi:hypothetical protein [Vibrio phage vB_VibM_10AMN]|uniref:Portal protein n=1 Tax=Staphylococcus phage vB_VibM_10AMN12 TaxID=3076785 RepID=A0AA96QZG2_9CAUD|nr:hypothetical protein [Vibrio phage vB_VibM_10AMN]WNO47498.1 hypothetical protein [Staphylococcus phage vB_VibM_10AMN12]